jgi:hypothetical protein
VVKGIRSLHFREKFEVYATVRPCIVISVSKTALISLEMIVLLGPYNFARLLTKTASWKQVVHRLVESRAKTSTKIW